MDYTQRLYGKIRLSAIRKNFSKGKIRNILGHDADPRFWTSHSQKYAIAVEEGNYSTTQRQMELQQLLHFKELGMQIADKSIIRAAFITNKRQVIADMEEQQKQQSDQQQQQAQQQAQIDQAKMAESMAKVQLNQAKVIETHANVHKIQAMAAHEEYEADLNLVKLAMELEDVQFNQIREAFELAQAMKTANQQEQQPEMAG